MSGWLLLFDGMAFGFFAGVALCLTIERLQEQRGEREDRAQERLLRGKVPR